MVFEIHSCISFVIFNRLVVATDDEKIANCCRGFGADVIMTSESCRNGLIFIDSFLSLCFSLM